MMITRGTPRKPLAEPTLEELKRMWELMKWAEEDNNDDALAAAKRMIMYGRREK